MKWSRWYWWAAGGVLLVLLIILVDKAEDVLAHIEYPMDVWRMDLDDMIANVGLFLGGLAAFLMVFKTAKDASRKADHVSSQINGGLSDIAKDHVSDALKDADVEIGLWRRVDELERTRQECLEELEGIKTWINRRLDDVENGRSNDTSGEST